ncbi:MAG TPA: hypothetical protein VMN99_13555 [Anaerolineales bacterium]|nr:hypothetical protein [Anaerolineales bacterium]
MDKSTEEAVGTAKMIEPLNYWMAVIGGVTVFVVAITNFLEALIKLMRWIPRPLVKFLVYSLTLVIPNIGIIWYFFYLAGSSPYRLSELRFFLAIVAQPTIAVSIYAYIWAKWLYPYLKGIQSETIDEKEEKGGPSQDKVDLTKKTRSKQKSSR